VRVELGRRGDLVAVVALEVLTFDPVTAAYAQRPV
jgi:hypothetical protein